MGGIALGVMALVVILSVMRGFDREVTERLLGVGAHVTIHVPLEASPQSDDIKKILPSEHLQRVTAFVEGEGIAEVRGGSDGFAQGVKVRGVDATALKEMRGVEIQYSRDPGSRIQDPENWIIVGREAAQNLLVHPDFDDDIELVAPLAEVGPTGEFVPRRKRFRVSGILHSGVSTIDASSMFIPRQAADQLFGLQKRHGFFVWFDDPHLAVEAASSVQEKLPQGWLISTWDQQNKKLFAALKLERVAMGLILAMTLVIASISIVGALFLEQARKRKDIAILSSLGMSRPVIRNIFLFHGSFIGGVGGAVGALCGVIVSFLLQRFPISLPASYYIETLPVVIEPIAVGLFFILGVSLAFVASLHPAWEASRMSPVNVLRYE